MNRYVRKIVSENCEALEKSNKTLEDVFRIMFSRPEEIMAEWLEDGERRFMTFAEGEKKIRNAAWALCRKIPAPGSFVALDMENSTRWIVSFWAILMAGCKPYLVNRRYPASLTRGIVSTLKIMFSVAEGETDYPCIFIDAAELGGEGHEDFQGRNFADEIALSTSATTLKETICIYNGRSVSSQIMNCRKILEENSLVPMFYHGALKQLAFLPFYHIFGLMAVYFWFSFFGRTMVFMADYSADSILNTTKKLEVTHIFAVPMLWHTIEKQVMARVEAQGKLKKFRKGLELSIKLQQIFPKAGRSIAKSLMKEVTGQLFGRSPAFLISGGGYIRESTLRFFNGLGYPLHNGYGMTEAGITSVELRENVKYRLMNSIGRPFESVTYEIGEDGNLLITGDSMCFRMIRDGEEIPMGSRYDSGDVVTCDENGYYFIKGRLGDRVIGESGENIDPDEIEKNLEFPFAMDMSVFGYGEGSDEETALVIRLGRDIPTDKIKATAEAAREQSEALPSAYRIRKFFFTFDPICSEKAIKVSRSYLKKGIREGSIRLVPFEDVLEGRVSGREEVAADNETGMRLRALFAEFTGKPEEEIHMDDHFIYDLGGTSLDYFSLVTGINESFGLHLAFDRESACYTIREFGKVILREEVRNE